MPKVLLFVPCEKVMRDVAGLISLINIVEKIEVKVPRGVPLPPAVPIRMETFSIWSMDQSEAGQYEEITELAVEGGPSIQTEPAILRSTKVEAPLDLIPAVNGRL